jgi:hypothetical protein
MTVQYRWQIHLAIENKHPKSARSHSIGALHRHALTQHHFDFIVWKWDSCSLFLLPWIFTFLWNMRPRSPVHRCREFLRNVLPPFLIIHHSPHRPTYFHVYGSVNFGTANAKYELRPIILWQGNKDVYIFSETWSRAVSYIFKGKAKPIISRGGPQGYEPPRLPHCLDNRLADDDKVVSLTRRTPFTCRKIPGTYFC